MIMYNEKQKEKFIEEYSRDQYIISLFNYCENIEKAIGKDVSCFREEEIYNLFKGMNSLSLDTLNVKLSVLRTYANWCERNNLLVNNMNCYNNIFKADIADCVNQKAKEQRIIDRDTMLDYCAELPNPADKLLLMCIFEGVKSGNALESLGGLVASDIHEDYIQLKDRRASITKELYEVAMETLKTDEYIPMFEVGTSMSGSNKLVNSNLVFRPKNNSKFGDDPARNAARLKMRFTKYISQYTNPNLTITSLFWSGIIYNAKQIAEERGIKIASAVYTNEFKPVIKQYGLKCEKKYIVSKFANYLN